VGGGGRKRRGKEEKNGDGGFGWLVAELVVVVDLS
jgi:hypothetical protein